VTVYIDETLTKTNLQRPDLIFVVTHLVRTKQANSVTEAFEMLNSGKIDVKEIENQIIKSFQTENEQ
jgi:hypothetical protein